MTIEVTDTFVVHQGNDAAVNFPYTFRIPDPTFANVYIRDVDTHEVVTTLDTGDYSITGTTWDNYSGGIVTYNPGTPLASDLEIVIERAVTFSQELDLNNQSGFYADSLEQQLDYTTMQILQLKNGLDRAPKLPVGELAPEFPSLVDQVNKILGTDDDAELAWLGQDDFQGPKGDPGAAGNVAATLAELKAADIANVIMLYNGAIFQWTTGNFTTLSDNVNFIVSNNAAITVGAWVRSTTATPEKLSWFSIGTPGSFTAVAGAAGNPNGVYTYAYTYVLVSGAESFPSSRIDVTLSHQKGSLSGLTPSTDPRVVARKIYRTVGNPSDVVKLFYVATIADNTTTTYLDNLADGGLGAAIKWTDSTGGILYNNGVQVASYLGNSVSIGENTGTGYACTAIGNYALASNTSGLRCTALGVYALTSNTTGDQNTGFGVHAGNSNNTGSRNTYFGYASGFSVTTGNDNTMFGNQAANSLPGAASGWCIFGSQSFLQNTQQTGQNTAFGALSGWNNITGYGNVFFGAYAGFYNTISNTLIIDNQQRTNESDEIDKCLVYGRFDAAATNQFIKFNAIIKSANCQGLTAALPGTASVGGAMNIDGSLYFSTGASGGSTNAWVGYNNGGVCGTITVNAGATAYNTTSDYRSKDDLGDLDPVVVSALIDNLRPILGRMKGTEVERPMLIAHEVAEAGAPYAVTGEKDATEVVDGKVVPKMQQLDYMSFMVPVLTELKTMRGRLSVLERGF